MAEVWITEFVERLKSSEHGDRSMVVSEYEARTGKSTSALWRIAKRNGYDTGRKARIDRGKTILNDGQICYVMALVNTSRREVKGTIMDVQTALDVAMDSGIIERGAISVSRMQSILRERNMNKAALNTPTPHIQLRSLHPNHVHVFDASVCIQYYLRGKKGMRIADERKFYKNKLQNYKNLIANRKLIRYVLADHFSGTLFLKYYYSAGETQDDVFDFLMSAWEGGKHERFPFRGTPEIVLCDRGSANISKAVLEFLKRLGVDSEPSKAHNPRRNGAAETLHNISEAKFESRLRFQRGETVAQLNEWAADWLVWFNGALPHTRHGHTRTQCWLKIREDELRELPDRTILQYLYENPPETRKVDGRYYISFQFKSYPKQYYRLKHIPDIVPGHTKVQVVLRPYHWPEVGILHNEVEYLVSPTETVEGGFLADAAVIGREFKGQPESETQKAVKRGDNLAFGQDHGKHATPFAGITVFGNQAEKVGTIPVPKKGTAPTGDHGVMEKRISFLELLKRLKPFVEITTKLNRELRERYGESVSLGEAEGLVELARTEGLTGLTGRTGLTGTI